MEKQIVLVGTLTEDDWGDETAKIRDYRVEAITKPATFVLVESLPYDFNIINYMWTIEQNFDGTIELGDDGNHSKFLADTDFGTKVIDRKSKGASKLVLAGNSIKLYLGSGTTGKINIHVSGILYKPSLL